MRGASQHEDSSKDKKRATEIFEELKKRAVVLDVEKDSPIDLLSAHKSHQTEDKSAKTRMTVESFNENKKYYHGLEKKSLDIDEDNYDNSSIEIEVETNIV